jgi:hypothetical protein
MKFGDLGLGKRVGKVLAQFPQTVTVVTHDSIATAYLVPAVLLSAEPVLSARQHLPPTADHAQRNATATETHTGKEAAEEAHNGKRKCMAGIQRVTFLGTCLGADPPGVIGHTQTAHSHIGKARCARRCGVRAIPRLTQHCTCASVLWGIVHSVRARLPCCCQLLHTLS